MDKISSGPTNEQALDFYAAINMPETVMTIIDIFDESERVKSLLTKAVKVLTQIKDRSLRKETASNAQKVKRAIDGLNTKFK